MKTKNKQSHKPLGWVVGVCTFGLNPQKYISFHGFQEVSLLQKWLMTMSAIMTGHMGSNSRLLLKITDHVVGYAEAYWHRRPNDRLYSRASASQEEQALAWYKNLCGALMMS